MNYKFKAGDILYSKRHNFVKIKIIDCQLSTDKKYYKYVFGYLDDGAVTALSVGYIETNYCLDKSSRLKDMINEL